MCSVLIFQPDLMLPNSVDSKLPFTRNFMQRQENNNEFSHAIKM